MSYNVFIVRPTEFDKKVEDPFSFDSEAGRISEKYISFSGVISKPIYLLFVAYIEWLLEHNELKSDLRKGEIRLRLEKLLVKCWQRKNKEIRGKSVIGSTFRDINPYKGNDGNWVIQNCFKIYGNSANILINDEIIERYHNDNREQVKYLKEFLKDSGSLETNKIRMKYLLEKLERKRHSIFRGNLYLSKKYRRELARALKEEIKRGKFSQDKKLIQDISNNNKKSRERIWNVLKDPKYPFKSLNNWFLKFILAVDSQINDVNQNTLWKRADEAYNAVILKAFNRRPETNNVWLDKNTERYEKNNTFDTSGWNAIVRRASQKDGVFYNFRINALISLLEELDSRIKD